MTSQSVSRSQDQSQDQLWPAVFADLAFWTVAGLLGALLCVPIGDLADIRPLWVAVGAAGLGVVAFALLLGLGRLRPVSRGLVWAFAIGNFALAPGVWLTAFAGWLPLSSAGNWALAVCGDAMLVLGLYQLSVLRKRTTS
jgi:hypothetical protein